MFQFGRNLGAIVLLIVIHFINKMAPRNRPTVSRNSCWYLFVYIHMYIYTYIHIYKTSSHVIPRSDQHPTIEAEANPCTHDMRQRRLGTHLLQRSQTSRKQCTGLRIPRPNRWTDKAIGNTTPTDFRLGRFIKTTEKRNHFLVALEVRVMGG